MAWAPTRESRAEWRAWAADAPGEGAAGSELPALPMMLRRRSGKLGQAAIGAALACSEVGRARYVFASRHGDLARTAGLLAAMAEGEAPSPADFSMSVHHAFAGLLSIHTANREGHTAIAAGPDSFGFGFLEAASTAAAEPETPTLLVYCDVKPPEEYLALGIEDAPFLPLVVALQFGPGDAAGERCRFSVEPSGEGAAGEGSVAHGFLRFLLNEQSAAVCQGERMTWRWSRDA